MRFISRLCSGHPGKTWVLNGRFCGLSSCRLMRVRFWLITFRTGRYRSKNYQKVWLTRYRLISTDRLSILRAKFLQKYYKVSCMQMRLSIPQWSIAREWTLWLVSCTWSTRMKRDRSLFWSTWLSGTPWVTYSIRTPSSCAKNSTSSTESSLSACQICTTTSK